jgi:hypothetical protein
MKRKINLDELLKVEASSVVPLSRQTAGVVQAIIKVRKNSYVPSGVRLRTSISPFIITGEFEYSNLESLENDPSVESVSISKPLKIE